MATLVGAFLGNLTATERIDRTLKALNDAGRTPEYIAQIVERALVRTGYGAGRVARQGNQLTITLPGQPPIRFTTTRGPREPRRGR